MHTSPSGHEADTEQVPVHSRDLPAKAHTRHTRTPATRQGMCTRTDMHRKRARRLHDQLPTVMMWGGAGMGKIRRGAWGR